MRIVSLNDIAAPCQYPVAVQRVLLHSRAFGALGLEGLVGPVEAASPSGATPCPAKLSTRNHHSLHEPKQLLAIRTNWAQHEAEENVLSLYYGNGSRR